MLVDQILSEKGSTVFTIDEGTTVGEAVAELRRWNVGALVVARPGSPILGVVSERDVVRAIADRGAGVLAETVAGIMTREVVTCGPQASVDDVMGKMTGSRIRHMPIVDPSGNGQLLGIISIGDVVKRRVDELETDRKSLEDYITLGR